MADQLDPPHSSARISDSGAGLALRFISGKYQGGEFPLEDNREIVIGRSSGLDMVLVEEMVSRRHARITVRGSELTIEDLGSTNGTFVNGEKITRARLREGDRVLIGTSILKVVPTASLTSESQARRSLEDLEAQNRPSRVEASVEGGARMAGTIDEIPLPDLLQLFATSKKNGVLVIRTNSRIGRIYLVKGIVHFARIDDQADIPPLKSVYRMLGWKSGVFQLDPPDESVFENPLDETVQAILMEGFRQQDELENLRSKLPPSNARLVLPFPLEARFRDLSPEELDVLQAALTSPTVEAIFDASSATDLDTGQRLLALMKKKYLTPA